MSESRFINGNFGKIVTDIVYGKEEFYIDAGGVMLMAYRTWKIEQTAKAKEFMEGYCRILASRKYGGSTSDIFARLDSMGKEMAEQWLKITFRKHCSPDDIMGLLNSL